MGCIESKPTNSGANASQSASAATPPRAKVYEIKEIDVGPRKRYILVIVDPQNDFHEGGSLAVAGATADTTRIAEMIRLHGSKIDAIYVTLDSHQRLHIAHGIVWKNAAGESPGPFTLITNEDIKAGTWLPRNAQLTEHALKYTAFLEAQGKYKLCIWPEHCIMGTPGHNVFPVLHEALAEWTEATGKEINYVMKGQNCLTEMYSAIKAEYEIPEDIRTQRDPVLQAQLLHTENLLVCGQALSHCVNATFTDIMDSYPPASRKNMVLLVDGCSSVTGFEKQGEDFIQHITMAGCRTARTTDVFDQ